MVHQQLNPAFSVSMWEAPVVIPTYLIPLPDPNPMFLEKRVYQTRPKP